MPFAVEGLEDVNVPTIEFEIRHVGTGSQPGGKPKESVRNVQGVGDLPQLTRADVDGLSITSLCVPNFVALTPIFHLFILYKSIQI